MSGSGVGKMPRTAFAAAHARFLRHETRIYLTYLGGYSLCIYSRLSFCDAMASLQLCALGRCWLSVIFTAESHTPQLLRHIKMYDK
jgi:hypothetical protein